MNQNLSDLWISFTEFYATNILKVPPPFRAWLGTETGTVSETKLLPSWSFSLWPGPGRQTFIKYII